MLRRPAGLLHLFGLARQPTATSAASQAPMPEDERSVILAFARGDDTLREQAISIHRRHMATLGVRGTPEQRFMAEIDNPCPDLLLRARYREALIG